MVVKDTVAARLKVVGVTADGSQRHSCMVVKDTVAADVRTKDGSQRHSCSTVEGGGSDGRW